MATMEGGVEPVRLLGPVDPKTGRRKPVVLPRNSTNTVSGKVRRKLVGRGKMRVVGGGSAAVVPIGGGRVVANNINTCRRESDTKQYGLSDPFGELEDDEPGGAKLKIRSPRNGSGSPAGSSFFPPAGKAVAATAPTACSSSILRTPNRSKSPSLPDVIDGVNRDRADSASSSVTFSVAFDLDESRSWSPLKDGGTPSAPHRSKSGKSKSSKSTKRSQRQSSAAEIKLAEFLKAETEAIRQLQQQDESPDDDDDDDARSVASGTSQRSFASADSKKLFEETTQAVREAEDTARKMREMMEWLEKNQSEQNQREQEEEAIETNQREQEEAAEHSGGRSEEKAEDSLPDNEVLDDRMVSLEELERHKLCSPKAMRSRTAEVQSLSQRGSVTSECVGATTPTTAVVAPPSAVPPSVDQTPAVSFPPESPSPRRLRHVSSSVAEYRRKRKAARQKKMVRAAKAVAAVAAVAMGACIFTVAKGGKMSLSVPRPQLMSSSSSTGHAAAVSGSESVDVASLASVSGALAMQTRQKRHAMGGAFALNVPPHEAAVLAHKTNRGKKIPFLGMGIGDGY